MRVGFLVILTIIISVVLTGLAFAQPPNPQHPPVFQLDVSTGDILVYAQNGSVAGAHVVIFIGDNLLNETDFGDLAFDESVVIGNLGEYPHDSVVTIVGFYNWHGQLFQINGSPSPENVEAIPARRALEPVFEWLKRGN